MLSAAPSTNHDKRPCLHAWLQDLHHCPADYQLAAFRFLWAAEQARECISEVADGDGASGGGGSRSGDGGLLVAPPELSTAEVCER